MPAEVRDLVVQECKPEAQGFKECAVIFSGLDAEVAGEIGEYLKYSTKPD
jgi:aspartate-semialdehyde dehydrogenase